MSQMPAQIGWQDYLAIILRRRWYFLLPCVGIVALALLVGFVMPRVYRAETVILAQEPNIMNPLINGLAVSTPVGERLRTLREEILGWTSLSRLVHELKLDRRTKNPVAFERRIKDLQQQIEVNLRGRDLIRISYEDTDPKLAQQVVNTISTIFLERNLASQASETDTAINFLNHELDGYKKKLEDSERTLRDFKELYATDMPVATELNAQIVQLQVQLAQLLIENTEEHPTVIETRRRVQELKERRNAEVKRFIATAVARGQDPGLSQDVLRVLDAPSTQTSTDPKVRMAQEAYQAWVNRLDHPVPATSGGAPQIAVIGQGEQGPRVEVVGAGPDTITMAPWQEQELKRLTRDYDVNASTYQHLQQRFEQAKITQRLGESDEGLKFKVLEPARLPLKPVKPNLIKISAFAFLLGLIVGVGTAFTAEYLDQSFQAAEDAQAVLGIPVLGSISTIVTEQDLANRRERMRSWLSVQERLAFLRERVGVPMRQALGARLDAFLVRWKL